MISSCISVGPLHRTWLIAPSRAYEVRTPARMLTPAPPREDPLTFKQSPIHYGSNLLRIWVWKELIRNTSGQNKRSEDRRGVCITKLLLDTDWRPFSNQFPKGRVSGRWPTTHAPFNLAILCRAEDFSPSPKGGSENGDSERNHSNVMLGSLKSGVSSGSPFSDPPLGDSDWVALLV